MSNTNISLMKINELTIRRLNKIVSPDTLTSFINGGGKGAASASTKDATKDELALRGAFLSNLYSLGFLLNDDATAAVKGLSGEELADILQGARAVKGDGFSYEPMYPNFPQQVMDASEAELAVNAMMHYFGDFVGARIVPVYSKLERGGMRDAERSFTVLGAADGSELVSLLDGMTMQSRPFSTADRDDILTLSEVGVPFGARFDAGSVKVKENLAFLAASFPGVDFSASFTSATDVLRLVAAYSGGDVSLAERTKFKLSRPQRRRVKELLDRVLRAGGSIDSHFEEWKKVAYALHAASESKGSWENDLVVKELVSVQNGTARTFNSLMERLVSAQDYDALKGYPSVFARRLAELVRKNPDDRDEIVEAFADVAHRVSVPVLVQMFNHFGGPDTTVLPVKTVRLHGSRPRSITIPNRIEEGADNADILDAVLFGLKNKGQKSGRKLVVLSKDASGITVPLGTSALSKGDSVDRGSRTPLDVDGEKLGTVRLFMHWKDFDDEGGRRWDSRVDLDLSTLFLDANFRSVGHVSYTNLSTNYATHSGDLTSAPNRAAEFLDIDIDKAVDAGVRYAVPSVYNFTHQQMNSIPEAYSGYMMREEVQSGEIFEPSTVRYAYDLNNGTTNATPFVIDLVEREVIWLHSSMGVSGYNQVYGTGYSYSGGLNNVESSMSNLEVEVRSAVLGRFMSVAELVGALHTVVDTDYELSDAEKAAGTEIVVVDPERPAEVLSLIEL